MFSKSKSDLILDVAIRTENLLRDLSSQLIRRSSVDGSFFSTIPTTVDSQAPRRPPSRFSPTTPSPHTVISSGTDSSPHPGRSSPNHISNATLSPFHASTTEFILSWPQFSEFRSLIEDRRFSVFHLESTRPSLVQRAIAMHPYMTKLEVENTVRSFERSINFWYPTMARATTQELQTQIISGVVEDSTRSCLALLVMALGCASQVVELSVLQDASSTDNRETCSEERRMSELWFDTAYRKIQIAQAEFTVDAVQCLLFTGYDVFSRTSFKFF